MPRLVYSSLLWAGYSYSYVTSLRVGAFTAASVAGLGVQGSCKRAQRRDPSPATGTGRLRGLCMDMSQPTKTVLGHQQGETVFLPGGITSIDHSFRLPLDWGFDKNNRGEEAVGDGSATEERFIEVFARELVLTKNAQEKNRPYLLFLQGGPGFPAPRVARPDGFCGCALKEFRVVMLDQRGTGRSNPVSHQSLVKMDSPEAQAKFLGNFRADSIIEDCEAIRRTLVGEDTQWTVLGQSFGGFCLLTYLSKHPEAVKAGLFMGGLAPVARTPDEVYRATYRRIAERNRRFYKRYPGDVQKVKEILTHLRGRDKPVELPAGGMLTPWRFLQLGLTLGYGGGFEGLHYLLEDAFCDGELKYSFLREVENRQPYDTNPMYAILHESIYLRGEGVSGPSNWSAERVLSDDPEVRKAFDWEGALEEGSDRPPYMVAEMIYRWMFDGQYRCLSDLKEAAELIATRKDWPALYDRRKLEECDVPCAGIVYYDDSYVEREFSEETSKLMPDCKIWVTNQYQHSGLRDDGEKIFETLLGMTRGEIDLPS